ncbi:hypothetical protein [Oscillibacter sp.]|uniref:hypothetical protein n=1 Tax=Oscillibacter sp. TaxID=1945593 RepID=UPI00261D7791|nr:hypothetical protein [Oscillibacter sp.]MDD3346758.1 hypothetical protein [Oscillibacter sp.]
MRKVQCGECRKNYDYDEDGFCPYCGAFNQPRRESGTSPVRIEGLNEAGHQNSFLHAEFHEENRERMHESVASMKRAARQAASTSGKWEKEKTEKSSPLGVIVWIVGAIILLNVFGNLLFLFF